MRNLIVLCVSIFSLLSFPVSAEGDGLLDARKGFKTKLVKQGTDRYGLDESGIDYIPTITYPTAMGDMKAYLANMGYDNKGNLCRTTCRFPAIIWIMGGFPVGGGSSSIWTVKPVDNDQSAKSYWQQNVVSLYPFLRGSAGNPGSYEGFYGEVDDVLAALEYLRGLDYVDPDRIYLGGHSTGATLALLVAAATDKFAGVFAFGPSADPVDGYGSSNFYHDTSILKENELRTPLNYINDINTPTYIIEGVDGNYGSLKKLEAKSNNKNLTFIAIKGANHFASLHPINRMIAEQIQDGQKPVSLNQKNVQARYYQELKTQRLLKESGLLELLQNQ